MFKGRITAEKLPEAKKAFIDPYITATGVDMVRNSLKVHDPKAGPSPSPQP